MFSVITSLFVKVPFLNNLVGRLINRYTAHGIIIIVMQLESMGFLPSGVTNAVDGLPTNQLIGWLLLAMGIYFICHMPKFKSKLERKQYELDMLKVELEIKQLKEELETKEKSNGIRII